LLTLSFRVFLVPAVRSSSVSHGMGLSEADTRAKLIDPRLHAAEWKEALIEREYAYQRGRIRLLGEQTVRDQPQFVDYLLREAPHGLILAVLEAKDEDHSPGDGLQQALAYANDVDVAFAYSRMDTASLSTTG
jgi:type I restriction enzyme, R subunit